MRVITVATPQEKLGVGTIPLPEGRPSQPGVPFDRMIHLCTSIRPSIGTKNLIPEEVNYTKIAIRVPVMNKVQFLLAAPP